MTICTHQRENIFGEIVQGRIKLNYWGEIAEEEWRLTQKKRLDFKIDTFCLMPNHIHGIVMIDHVGAYCNTPLPERQNTSSPSQTIGAMVRGFKGAVVNRIKRIEGNQYIQIWQRNYYEHIIRNEKDYWAIKQYINDNPKNWEKDELWVR